MKKILLATAMLMTAASVEAAPIFVAGPNPVAPFAGTVIDFEGLAEGTKIDTQYAGVTISQFRGGRPQIDNAPGIFGYGPGSGSGMLTGSTEGGYTFDTTAGIRFTFAQPVSSVGVFFSDTSTVGPSVFNILDNLGTVIETFTVTQAMMAAVNGNACGGFFPTTPGCGVFVGFTLATNSIFAFERTDTGLGNGEAYSLDDFRYARSGGGQDVSEPATLALLGAGLLGLAAVRRRKTA